LAQLFAHGTTQVALDDLLLVQVEFEGGELLDQLDHVLAALAPHHKALRQFDIQNGLED